MEKEQRNRLQKATQDARKLLEEEFRSQLLQTYDIDVEKVRWAEEPGAHLQAEQRLIREKLVAWIEHKEAQINDRKEALLLSLREMAFTALNRFVALKLMEASELVRPCVSGGLESEGFIEFAAVAQGLLADQESSYRLYVETIFEDLSRELRALFDPRDPAILLWPKRTALLELLEILNRPELAELWGEDETLGWVYQYFNGEDVKEMRNAVNSRAPRNGREQATRNQFFTPRYVVEFLTDNTLGRAWRDITGGETNIQKKCTNLVATENSLSRQESQTIHKHHQELSQTSIPKDLSQFKDPRNIRMLDPACGSMHFGLYSYEVFKVIYSEAWDIVNYLEDEEKANTNSDLLEFKNYALRHANKEIFFTQIPKLILETNIHGVDIDPRAIEVAKIALWLKAQRDWNEQKIEIKSRPRINEMQIVCAEPMPGERDIAAHLTGCYFQEEEKIYAERIISHLLESMILAGELGTLLKFEDILEKELRETIFRWEASNQTQLNLYDTKKDKSYEIETERQSKRSKQELKSWQNFSKKILNTLQSLCTEDPALNGFRESLYASKISQAMKIIEICSQKYDVVLMNPPFGLPTDRGLNYSKNKYPNSYTDLLATFVERGLQLSSMYVGAITSRSFMVATRLSEWRKLVAVPHLTLIADLGENIMDGAFVESAAYVLAKRESKALTAFDLRESESWLKNKSNSTILTESTNYYSLNPSIFNLLPKSRIIYTLSKKLEAHMRSGNHFEPQCGTARQGLASWDDFRFVRTHWEVDPNSIGQDKVWEPLMKGGSFSRYLHNVHLLMNWNKDGAECRAINMLKNGSEAQAKQASNYWRLPGLTYSLRSQKGFSTRILPKGCLFASQGPLIKTQSETSDLYILGWINSRLITSLIETQSNDGKFMSGLIKSLPWIQPPPDEEKKTLEEFTFRTLTHLNSLKCFDELDQNFIGLPVLQTLSESTEYIKNKALSAHKKVKELDKEWNRYINMLYSVSEDEINELSGNQEYAGEGEEASSVSKEMTDLLHLTEQRTSFKIISYLLGISFGAWIPKNLNDIESHTSYQGVFEQLPVIQPARLSADHSCSENQSVKNQSTGSICKPSILITDKRHNHNTEEWIEKSLHSLSVEQDRFGCESLMLSIIESLHFGTLKEYLIQPNGFFADHLQHYSMSRRQSPTYWQISAKPGNHAIWVYYQKITKDTIYKILNEYVEPTLSQLEREIFEAEASGLLSSDDANRFENTRSYLEGFKCIKNELSIVAPLWSPNLHDGVIINHAILWRITPYTPWQKKCKECWDKLVKGDYDWAHLAFHLWPERVIPKCNTDRSLAIAHGLEERLWQETNNGNWLPRQLSEEDLQALIAEHSNPAVKSALERFLAAPPPVAPAKKRAKRASSASPRKSRNSAVPADPELVRQVLLTLTAAPDEGLSKNAIAELQGVEPTALTAVIKQLKTALQIEQLGTARGAKYKLTEQGRSVIDAEAGVEL